MAAQPSSGGIEFIRHRVFVFAAIVALLVVQPHLGLADEIVPFPARMFVHAPPISTVQFTYDGGTLLTAGGDRTVKLWNVMTGQLLRSLGGHSAAVTSVGFSPDASQVFTGSEDGTIKVWNVATQHVLRSMALPGSGPIHAMDFLPDGEHALAASQDGLIRRWNIATRQVEQIYVGHSGAALSLASTTDRTRFLTGSADGTAIFWDAANESIIHRLTGHVGPVRSISMTAIGGQALTGGDDGIVKVWDLISGGNVNTLTLHEQDPVHVVALSPDGSYALTASLGLTVVWNATTWQTIAWLPILDARACSFSPDGSRFGLGTGHFAPPAVRIYGVADQNFLRYFSAEGHVTSVAFSRDGTDIIAGTEELRGPPMAQSWPEGDPNPMGVMFFGNWRNVDGATISHDGSRVLTCVTPHTGDVEPEIGIRTYLWDVATGGILSQYEAHLPQNVAFFPGDDRILVTGGTAGGQVEVFDTNTGNRLLHIETPCRFAAISPDGSLIIAPGENGWALLDAISGELRVSLTDAPYFPETAAFSPDGEQIAVAGYWGSSVVLLDAHAGTAIRNLVGHSAPVNSVMYSPDSRRVLTGSNDNTAKMWDAETGQLLRTFLANTGPLSVAFSPDGEWIVTGGGDGVARVWEAGSAYAKGDANCDRIVDGRDIAAFVLALLDETRYAQAYPDCTLNRIDVNGDGSNDGADVAGMIEQLLVP